MFGNDNLPYSMMLVRIMVKSYLRKVERVRSVRTRSARYIPTLSFRPRLTEQEKKQGKANEHHWESNLICMTENHQIYIWSISNGVID